METKYIFLTRDIPQALVFDVKEASGDAGGDLTLTVLDWDLASAPDQVGRVMVLHPESLNLNPHPQPRPET